MSKYVKVMFGTTSGAKSDFEYKIGEVLDEWNCFIFHDGKGDRKDINPLVKEIEVKLNNIKNN